MDVATLVVEGLVALASGAVGALSVVWSLGRKLQRVEDVAKSAWDKSVAVERDQDADRARENDRWQELNRTLGQIEGQMMGGGSRGRLPSRSG